ncbi:MAG TPA: hypothetical protein VHC19_01650 [Pirellulales bacterium]|jgi:hypothetical protein|nr:hypothetical protein [Pirellulales bacterium]
MSSRIFLANLLATFVLIGGLASAQAEDFHVDNKLFFPEQEPIVSTTLFFAGRVYDFLDKPQETIVFDKNNDLIVILDPQRKMKTEITTGNVSTDINRLREAARSHKRESIRMSAAPRFSETINPETGRLIMDGKWIKYIVATEAPQNPFAARQYNEFADWLAQVNALLNPPMMPFARLKLNEVLKQRQEIPVEIELTLGGEGRRKPLVVRSEHNIQWALSQADKERIDQVAEQLHTFNLVSFEEYHRPPQNAQAGK